ncbi:MAG: helix-turn-helix domain-containing protein [Velocimicrobium sp.]
MYTIFEQLLQTRGITTYRISKDTGIAQSVFSAWKNGISTPKQDKMKKIANYFGVSVEYLMTGEEIDASIRPYYLNEETTKVAQEIFENKDLRLLFDVAKGSEADKLFAYAKFLQSEKEKKE